MKPIGRDESKELTREGEPDRSRGDDGPGDLFESPEPAGVSPQGRETDCGASLSLPHPEAALRRLRREARDLRGRPTRRRPRQGAACARTPQSQTTIRPDERP